MFRTILVPLDGSQRAEAILPHVEDLAMQSQGKLVLLEIVEPPTFSVIGPGGAAPVLNDNLYRELLRAAETYLADVQARVRAKGIEATTHVGVGAVVGQILEVARQEQVDMIAMASHGRTGVTRVFYGSVAAGVLHAVDRPLLLVRSVDV